MKFRIVQKDKGTAARAGEIITDHGLIHTPVFMPVGTSGSIKGIHQRELEKDLGIMIILANTYHLFLRPGNSVIQEAGGLHKFMNWNRSILTDSGGYQVFSHSGSRKIREDGVVFQSHIDGSKHIFTPESVVETQRIIGADIIMALDECTPYPCDFKYAEKSLKRTNRWIERGIKKFRESDNDYGHSQSFFPIVQGSTYKELRVQAAEIISSMEMEGNAIGGLSVGEPAEEMYSITETVTGILPWEKPRYLMGVGTPMNILETIALGIDMFDCVMPTRNGRNGMLFTWEGIINIKNEKWKYDFEPLDKNGDAFVDTCYSKAYLRHLILSGEILGAQIASIHNLAFYLSLVKTAREKIISGEFSTWKSKTEQRLATRL